MSDKPVVSELTRCLNYMKKIQKKKEEDVFKIISKFLKECPGIVSLLAEMTNDRERSKHINM